MNSERTLFLVIVLLLALALAADAGASSRRHRNKKKASPPAVEQRLPAPVDSGTPISGEPMVSPQQMWEFVVAHNDSFPYEIAEAYYNIGLRYGIRGDIALCQSILETGWFKFTGNTAVTPDQHNYCGLGVTSLGMKGHEFASIEEGVTAQIQHLYAYACRDKLPPGEKVIDPRFSMVTRGIAPFWESLNLRWAANDHYGQVILSLYERMASPITETTEIGIEIPEEFFNE